MCEIIWTVPRAELEILMNMAVNPPAAAKPSDSFTVADPGATALATYLSALGLTVETATISQWLVLVPVLALEIGSALAGVLAGIGSVDGDGGNSGKPCPVHARTKPFTEPCMTRTELMAARTGLHSGEHTRSTPENANNGGPGSLCVDKGAYSCEIVPLEPVRASGRDEAMRRILAALHTHNGKIDTSLRTLADGLAINVSTLRGAITALASAGEIAIEQSSSGTTLRLAG